MLILNAIERGWFAETGAHSAQHQNTATGIAGDLGILRAFIVFEMPRLSGSITGASLGGLAATAEEVSLSSSG